MMRILYVSTESLNKAGGTALRIRELCAIWAKRNHEVFVLAPQYGGRDPIVWSAVIHLVRFPARNIFYYLLFELYSLFFVPLHVLKKKYDVVISTGGVLSWILYKLVRLTNRPYVVELNGIADIETTRMHSTLIISKLREWVIRYSGLYKGADLFICVADGIRTEIVRRHPSVAGKSIVIGNGIDPSRFYVRNRSECRRILGIDQSLFVFGFVGLLCPWHGTEDLITATCLLKGRGHADFKILIVGTGDRYSALRSQVIRGRVEDLVQFAGRISPEVVPLYMGSFNVACQVHNDPVIGRLGDSMKFWEYLASGLPVIVSDMSGSSRHVRPGRVGWKYRGGDPVELADRMEYAMRNLGELSGFKVVNRDLAVDGHRWEDIAGGIIAAIERVQERFKE